MSKIPTPPTTPEADECDDAETTWGDGLHIGDCPHPHDTEQGLAWRQEFIRRQAEHETVNGGYERRHAEVGCETVVVAHLPRGGAEVEEG